jgi:trehalose_treC: alpha,alpha-phosphotrehalase
VNGATCSISTRQPSMRSANRGRHSPPVFSNTPSLMNLVPYSTSPCQRPPGIAKNTAPRLSARIAMLSLPKPPPPGCSATTMCHVSPRVSDCRAVQTSSSGWRPTARIRRLTPRSPLVVPVQQRWWCSACQVPPLCIRVKSLVCRRTLIWPKMKFRIPIGNVPVIISRGATVAAYRCRGSQTARRSASMPPVLRGCPSRHGLRSMPLIVRLVTGLPSCTCIVLLSHCANSGWPTARTSSSRGLPTKSVRRRCLVGACRPAWLWWRTSLTVNQSPCRSRWPCYLCLTRLCRRTLRSRAFLQLLPSGPCQH